MIKHIMLVSHTHWDPEWYSTFEEYRIRLVTVLPAEIHKYGWEFNAPLRTVNVAPAGRGTLPPELSFCRVEGAVAGALKKAEQGENLILRVYNIKDAPADTVIEIFNPVKQIQLLNLAEEPMADSLPMRIAGNKVYFTLPARKIVTLGISVDKAES